MPGIFTISLDFELHWGVFDKRQRRERERIYKNTLQLVPRLLAMFEQYNVHVTWATVGGMFARNESEWNSLKPVHEPLYAEERYSAYVWVRNNGLSDEYEWAHFAPDTIRQIITAPGQELATHTFSHYYCLEPQSNSNAFESDLIAAQRAASALNTTLTSLVFPRNQFNAGYLKTCFEHGITAVRSNPANWFWRPVNEGKTGLLRKLIRTSDAYIQLGKQRTSYPLSSIVAVEGEPLQLPASRFFRPWRSKYKFANKLRLRHMCNELKQAAVHDECYHLWFHPENFGDHPEENMANLQQLLEHYEKCSNRYGMTSWNMAEYAQHLSVDYVGSKKGSVAGSAPAIY